MLELLFSSTKVFAQAAAAAPAPAGPSTLEALLPFIVIFAVMYFLIIRPQAKKQKDHQAFVNEMKKGDEVITASGILGRIEGLTDSIVTLEISEGVRIKVLKNQITGSQKNLTVNNEGKK